jgi:PAS domain S-box-containing protein
MMTAMENRQRVLLSAEQQGVVETDADGQVIWANRAYLQCLNASLEEVLGSGWKNFVHPDSKTIVFAEWESAVHEGRDFRLDHKVLAGDGRVFGVHTDGFVMRDEKGKTTGFLRIVKPRLPEAN